MTRKAIICGGSIAGVFAANALNQEGWQVEVYESTSVELSGRGAGIVTHPELLAAFTSLSLATDDLGVRVAERVAFDRDDSPVRRIEFPQVVTSWDRIHQLLRAEIPDERYFLGHRATGFEPGSEHVAVHFRDRSARSADLLVAADGFRSALRAQMLPEIVPRYAGYVVWRTLAHEGELSARLKETVFSEFGFFAPSGMQIIGYPIAGLGNDLRVGHRRYNFVWYLPVEPDRLTDMLTDATGRLHEVSIPPPLVRNDVVADMRVRAERSLPPVFVEMLAASERPFFTPIYDHHSPVMAEGRVALVGDAACVARPHVGMGVTKAAQDALALARCLRSGSVSDALTAYSAERVVASRLAYEQGQVLGRYMLADLKAGQVNDGRSNPHLDEILRLTAAVPGSG